MQQGPHSGRRRSGFTLVELMIVIAIIAIVASVAMPKLQHARTSANEVSAVATLRAVLASQNQVVSSPAIDTDADGIAEFGYFAELAGSVPARISVGGAPAAGVPGTDELVPSPLLSTLGGVNQSVLTRAGYIFQIWLPGPSAGGLAPGIPEDPTGGKTAAAFPDPDTSENAWCAYAWPLTVRYSGTPCYFVNQEGVLMQSANRGAAPYSGIGAGPGFDAAFSQAGNMTSPIAINGVLGADGNLWVPVK
jgi:prepilin-type N-terminal cleavage/methylation domain-containing protein